MARDDALWMPFTANRAFRQDPRMVGSAKGMYLTDTDGRELLDAVAGLWCVNAGHGRPEIAEAVARQLSSLDYGPAFQFGHPGAFEAAEAIRGLLPEGFGSVFFTNSGSEAADTALKIALAYHAARGETRRTRLVGRLRGYHGVNFGGLSVGGIARNRRQFGPLLPNVDHLRDTHDPARNAFSRGQPAQGEELADDLKRIIALHGAETIAAVIVEPMAGSGGVLIPPKGYLERLRRLCSDNGILLIFDEVITGFGRLGAAFAAHRYGVTPDIITMAKGLTNGSIPMGAVASRHGIREAVFEAAAEPIELFHGYTYSGHPVACAAALAALKIYADEDLFARAASLAPAFETAVHSLAQSPGVVDIRNDGLVAGVELAPAAEGPGHRGHAVFTDCYRRGVVVRVTGDIIALSPPLIVEEPQIDRMVSTLGEAIRLAA
ncbi:MAG TPA: aspartate aminotransferase family protein [Caulobacteraceae bacterium]|nr:aspartate aminotransferase family protein [Caulobacteraceae bacterium]